MLTISAISGSALTAGAVQPAIPQDPKIEAAVEKTLAAMSLDEKIGQMTELSIDVLGSWKDGEFFLDPDKVHEAIAVYKVGSVLNAPGGPTAQTPAKWEEIIGYLQKISMQEIGIPCIYGLDQNHGTTYTLGGILFPQNINVGASFNAEMAREFAADTRVPGRRPQPCRLRPYSRMRETLLRLRRPPHRQGPNSGIYSALRTSRKILRAFSGLY